MTIVNTNIAETINIDTNGTYDVARYTTANVSVPAPKLCVQYHKDANGKITTPTTIIDLDGATDVADYVFYYEYYNNTSVLGSVNLSSLTNISGQNACSYMFYGTGITSVDLSSLTTINGQSSCNYMFGNCQKLTSVDLSSLTTISAQSVAFGMFDGCKKLTSVNLSSLETVSGNNGCQNMFHDCKKLGSISFNSLKVVSGSSALANMFDACSLLTSVSFPALTSTSFGSYTNQFGNMVRYTSGCTIHFPSNLDPQGGSTVISSLTGYPNFGGTNTVLAFDLPATE